MTEKTQPARGREKLNVERSLLARAVQRDKEALEILARQFIGPDEKLLFADYLGVQGLWGLGVKSFMFLTDARVAALRVGPFGEVVYQDGFLEYINSGVVVQKSRLFLFLLLILSTAASVFVILFAQTGYHQIKKSHRFATSYEKELKQEIAEAKAAGGDTGEYERLLRWGPDRPETWQYLFLGALLLIAPLSIPVLWLFSIRLYYRMFKSGLVLWIREGVSVYGFCNRGSMLRANELYRQTSEARVARVKELGIVA